MRALRSRSKAVVLGAAMAMAMAGAESQDRRGDTRVYTLDPSLAGDTPEGIAYDERTGAFFVGSAFDGTIYRGTLDNPTLTPYIPGQPGRSANGLRVVNGRLYVAGGFTGTFLVFDLTTREVVASFGGFGAGMINDLEVTQHGDVYLTDSTVQTLWHISAEQIAAGGGTPEGIPVGPEIPYDFSPFAFNLNGIVALRGGKSLIVDASNSGKLYRIDLDPSAPLGRTIQEIAVEPLPNADGMHLDGSDLLVVQGGSPATLNVLRLDGKLERGQVVERRTDPAMPDSSGVTRARNYYLVVNFDLFTGILPHSVAALPRNFGDQ